MNKPNKIIFILILFVVLILCQPLYAIDDSNLVAHWTFDEGAGATTYDSAGSNNGALKGSTSWVAGRIGDYALYFNNQQYDYVQGANSPFDFVNTTFTACCWFKTTSQLYVLSEGSYLHGGWSIDTQGGKIHIQMKEGSYNAYDAYYGWSQSGGYSDGEWHFVAAVMTTSTTNTNGNKAKVYVDGSPIILDDHNRYPYSPTADLWRIGSLQIGHLPLSFQGSVDDIRIYNCALTDKEVLHLYNESIELPVAVDIRPASCPNPLNLKSRGLIPVAILGSQYLDVNSIDIASIRLAGAAPVRSNFEDVATPTADVNDCHCTTAGPDGYRDLVLKFKTQDIARQLIKDVGEIEKNAVIELTLTGFLTTGRPIKGTDCIRIVGNIPQELKATKADINGDGIIDFIDISKIAEFWLETADVE